jgi:hypothetical protein
MLKTKEVNVGFRKGRKILKHYVVVKSSHEREMERLRQRDRIQKRLKDERKKKEGEPPKNK